MDLLLQRIGRLQRHPKRSRPQPLQTAVCAVLDTGTEEFDRGSEAVYGQWLLWRTRACLPESICLPEDISPLVQKVYGWEQADVLPEEERSEGMCKAYEFAQAQRKERAQAYLVPQPKVHKRFKQLNTLDGWMQNVSAHSDAAARAAVWDAFFRQELELLPATLPDALRTHSPSLLTDLTAQDLLILEDTLEFLADRTASVHAGALPGDWDADAGRYTLTEDSRAAVQALFNVSPTDGQLSSASEP